MRSEDEKKTSDKTRFYPFEPMTRSVYECVVVSLQTDVQRTDCFQCTDSKLISMLKKYYNR